MYVAFADDLDAGLFYLILENGDLKMVHIKIYCFREIFCICSCLPTTFTPVFSVTSVRCNSILQHHGYRTACYRTGSGATKSWIPIFQFQSHHGPGTLNIWTSMRQSPPSNVWTAGTLESSSISCSISRPQDGSLSPYLSC